jgi:hypothetical protein
MHSDADSDVQAVCQEALALVQALGGEGITWTDAAMYLVTAGTLSELVSPIVPALNSGDHHAAAVEIGIDKILTEACQLIYDLIALQAGRALSLHRDAPEAASMETMLRSLVDADAGGPLTSDQGRLLEGVGPHLLWLSIHVVQRRNSDAEADFASFLADMSTIGADADWSPSVH